LNVQDVLDIKKTLEINGNKYSYMSLKGLEGKGYKSISKMPYSIKILLECVLRQIYKLIKSIENSGQSIVMGFGEESEGTELIKAVESLLNWKSGGDIPFQPARVLMQDFTGVPAVVDLAVMRDAVKDLGGDPLKINPQIPVNLVIDHSVQVDWFGSAKAFDYNFKKEFERNIERYEFLRWASETFDNFTVVPPATGICHQVNLEYLANVVMEKEESGEMFIFPDTLVGTDSHTVMINGLGVLGWGVGGIEAEAALLGEPVSMRIPEVIGFKLKGELKKNVTATDLVLTITNKLREYGVVGKFVEFFGPGLKALNLADRAVIGNMAPEYGATMGFSPVDEVTVKYLKDTGRSDDLIEKIKKYLTEQGLFDKGRKPDFSDVIELDLSKVEFSIAGPKRPQDLIPLSKAKQKFGNALKSVFNKKDIVKREFTVNGLHAEIEDGSVVIAAITSCTNTSSPSVMITAGLLARNAVKRGLKVKNHVKTSFAPGSRVVTEYLDNSGLQPFLDALGYQLVGYGCTTCIGNSGPLNTEIVKTIEENDIVAVSVLSGNRNFEGRIHANVKANYLASPPLVIAYAIAGTMNIDITSEPLGKDPNGEPVFLNDIWPAAEEVDKIIRASVTDELFKREYSNVYSGNKLWNNIKVPGGNRFKWQKKSTYIRKPTFFDGLTKDVKDMEEISSARVLAFLGDSVTTDHISPAGAIPADSPAAKWLMDNGVKKEDFNTYGSRRGNHEVMMRGTFGNIRIKNKLVPGVEGGYTVYLPDGKQMSIFEASEKYMKSGVPLIVVAGRDYGMGSSRDWAAKGTVLLGVKAVIAESYERIHRSNLIGMGVIPLQFEKGQNADSLGITGRELFTIEKVEKTGQKIKVKTNSGKEFNVKARVDTQPELEYLKNRGILHTILRRIVI
jgi:aconitate hydratase